MKNLLKYLTSELVFFIILTICFFAEGLGFRGGRELSYFLIISSPFFLLLLDRIKQKKIVGPKNIILLFTLFLLFTCYSIFFSLNKQNAFEGLLLYISYFFFFVYGYNYKEKIKKFLTLFIFAFSFIYCLYSIILHSFIKSSFLIPTTGYQFVYSTYASHNHLGDFLLLIICILIFSLKHPIENIKIPLSHINVSIKNYRLVVLLSLLFLILFFLFSFSRSAYLDFLILILIIFRYKDIFHIKYRFLITGLIGISLFLLFFFFVTVSEFANIKIINIVQKSFLQNYELKHKEFLGSRNSYFNDAVNSIMKYPWGVGSNNFFYISQSAGDIPGRTTYTSHNLFLDIFSENGVGAGVIIILILTLLLKSKKNIYFLFFIILLLNFQTDYTYKIYSYSLLFFVIGGIIYEEKQLINLKHSIYLVTIIFLVAIGILISNALLNLKRPLIAMAIYPLNKQVYDYMISSKLEEHNIQPSTDYISIYESLFPGDNSVLRSIGQLYEKKGNRKEAYLYYIKSLDRNPMGDIWVLEKIYQFEGKQKSVKIEKFFNTLSRNKYKDTLEYGFRIESMKFCQRVYNFHCPYDL